MCFWSFSANICITCCSRSACLCFPAVMFACFSHCSHFCSVHTSYFSFVCMTAIWQITTPNCLYYAAAIAVRILRWSLVFRILYILVLHLGAPRHSASNSIKLGLSRLFTISAQSVNVRMPLQSRTHCVRDEKITAPSRVRCSSENCVVYDWLSAVWPIDTPYYLYYVTARSILRIRKIMISHFSDASYSGPAFRRSERIPL